MSFIVEKLLEGRYIKGPYMNAAERVYMLVESTLEPWTSQEQLKATLQVAGDPASLDYEWFSGLLTKYNVSYDVDANICTFPETFTDVIADISVEDTAYIIDFVPTTCGFLHKEVYREVAEDVANPAHPPENIRKFLNKGALAFLEELAYGKPIRPYDPFDL